MGFEINQRNLAKAMHFALLLAVFLHLQHERIGQVEENRILQSFPGLLLLNELESRPAGGCFTVTAGVFKALQTGRSVSAGSSTFSDVLESFNLPCDYLES